MLSTHFGFRVVEAVGLVVGFRLWIVSYGGGASAGLGGHFGEASLSALRCGGAAVGDSGEW